MDDTEREAQIREHLRTGDVSMSRADVVSFLLQQLNAARAENADLRAEIARLRDEADADIATRSRGGRQHAHPQPLCGQAAQLPKPKVFERVKYFNSLGDRIE